jgi:cystathionine beta-lyase
MGHVVSDLAGRARMFLDRARVAVSSGHVFGHGGAGFVRLHFATSPAILRQAIRRMGMPSARRTGPNPRRAQP